MSNQPTTETNVCDEDFVLLRTKSTQHESRSSPVLYTSNTISQDLHSQPPKQQIFSVPQHTQQRVHVIQKNIYSMAPINSGSSSEPDNTTSNTLNRQIIVQPKSIVTNPFESGTTTQSIPKLPSPENLDDPNHLQYSNLSTSFRSSIRPSKKMPISNIPPTTNQLPTNTNPSENVNVVFRAPVVSSSSNQSMRPPPNPPPPKIKGHSEEPSSSIPDLEFDGTTVLCRVCGDKASGFHYGVHSCEGCKGFFRRSIQQKIQYRPCTKNQQCSILRINRNRCQYCRLKKCIAVGMSRDAVRFGRVPKREKARILAAMQQSTQNRGHQRAMATELDDQPRLLAAVLRAHMETCEFTREKVTSMRQRARECPSYSLPTMACPLNPAPELQSEQEFSQRFAHVIRGVIDFAGMIPGFQLLTQDDKFTLLKAGLFDALFVRLICMFDISLNSIICLNGQVMRRNSIQNGANARFLVDSTFNFAERMNAMNLSDSEIGLFCAIVLISADRPGLRNIELVEKMHSRLKGCLQTVISQNRPDDPDFMIELLKLLPDLRTLSTLHTEKLVVFRTEHKEMLRQQMWSMEDESNKSSGLSPWSCNDQVMEDDSMHVLHSMNDRSTSSVSSTESGDTASDYSQSLSQSAPLLAATLAGGCPMRLRANSGSSAEDDIVGTHHLTQNGLTITPVVRSTTAVHHIRYRKLDSPTDSGIESGNEKADHKAASSESSSCSSPRSSVDDLNEEKRPIAEDMPVLKRVLQAPPLYDTNSLMDEAYKPHKKFRALRNHLASSCHSIPTSNVSTMDYESEADAMQVQQTIRQQSPTQAQNNSIQSRDALQSTTESLKSDQSAIRSAKSPQTNIHQSQLHMHLTRPIQQTAQSQQHSLSAPNQNQHQHHQSSLSSTHSVLARSLMEEPRMTPEQIKRSDIIQNYIKRESQVEQHQQQQQQQQQRVNSQGLLVCALSSGSNQKPNHCPYTGASRLQNSTLSVITTTRQHTPSPSSTPISDQTGRYSNIMRDVSSPTSPHSTSSTSPNRLDNQIENVDKDGQVLRSTMVSLLQPLNLSKKSPSPVQQQLLQSA